MSLPWIRVYNDLPDHPKSDHLAALLDDRRAWTYVVQLWLWASRVKPDGDLSGLHPSVIAKRAGWDGDPMVFVDAMQEVGFLDENKIHDWVDFQGAHAKKLEKDRSRIRQLRDKTKNVAATVAATVPTSVAGSVAGSVPPLEERRGERDKNKNLALFENQKGAGEEGAQDKNFFSKAPRRGRPPKEQSPEAVAARETEKADGERWMVKARLILGLDETQARWSTATWMAFRRARKARGIDQLLQSLEGLTNDKFSATAGLGWLISDNGITKGLAKYSAGASGVHVSRVQHRVGSSADGYDPFL
jgi:hypothetical protein